MGLSLKSPRFLSNRLGPPQTSQDTLRMPEIAVELPLTDIFADAGLSDEDATDELEAPPSAS